MTTLRERLTEVFVKELKESHENSKEMIASNSTSFDEMGMANTAPGEFAQEEITDRKNLENTGSMANDTDFEGKVSCEDGSECPACDIADKIDDTMDSLASDIIDISVKDDEEDDEFFDDDDEEDEDEDEKRIMTIAHESAKNSLMNILKKKLNEDRFSEEKFVVYLWPFAGYQMIPFEVEASNEEEALEKAVAKAEEEGEADVFADDVEDGIFNGTVRDAKRDIVCLNAGAVLYVDGKAPDLKSGVKLAEETIDSMKVQKLLDEIIEAGNIDYNVCDD